MADNRIIPTAKNIAMHKLHIAHAKSSHEPGSDVGSAQSRDRSMDRLVVTYPAFLYAASAALFPSMNPKEMPVTPHTRHLARLTQEAATRRPDDDTPARHRRY